MMHKKRDYLWDNISSLPYFRGLLRAVEARFYEHIQLPEPILDLGCGDGHFSNIAFKKPLTVGLDPWTGPVSQAYKTGNYKWVIQGKGDRIPCSDAYFSCAVSNSVLEHIPDLEPVIKELNRVLMKGSPFIFCVPNDKFLKNLSIARFFDKLGLMTLAGNYRKFFNKISRHHHCDPHSVWESRLNQCGFKIEKCWDYFSPSALSVLEWGHYFGLPALVSHFLFKKWILSPTKWNLALTKLLIEKHYNENPEQPDGAYSFYITRKL